MSKWGDFMMQIGLTTYGINIRDINDHQYELHDVLGNNILDIIEQEHLCFSRY